MEYRRAFFHPRYALLKTGDETAIHYHIPDKSTKLTMSFGESLAKGLSVIETVALNDIEKEYISSSINYLTKNQLCKLDAKYMAWKLTWKEPEIAMHSVLRMYAKSKEYDDFIEYCKSMGDMA
ncbi:MAG: hypothetical protein JW894_10310, partial [Bacteroidales bacterium]|nr:hypothetical protein [Bacteroidales bacterium]